MTTMCECHAKTKWCICVPSKYLTGMKSWEGGVQKRTENDRAQQDRAEASEDHQMRHKAGFLPASKGRLTGDAKIVRQTQEVSFL